MENSNYERCSKCNKVYYNSAIRKCPHEAVNKVYGKYICYDCCMNCKYEYEGYMGRGYCELLDKKKGREIIKYKHYWDNGKFKIEVIENERNNIVFDETTGKSRKITAKSQKQKRSSEHRIEKFGEQSKLF